MSKQRKKRRQSHQNAPEYSSGPKVEANWNVPCMNCEDTPTVGQTGLCGPCCFGEADTVNGNW